MATAPPLSASEFAQTAWLHAVGAPVEASADSFGSLEEIRAHLELRADEFLAGPYTSPYQDWCVRDHSAASAAPKSLAAAIQGVGKRAYVAAWAVLPHPEICGLVSDDVATIYALLLMSEAVPIREFTRCRAEWLMRGRVPWGYRGEFPAGRWLVL